MCLDAQQSRKEVHHGDSGVPNLFLGFTSQASRQSANSSFAGRGERLYLLNVKEGLRPRGRDPATASRIVDPARKADLVTHVVIQHRGVTKELISLARCIGQRKHVGAARKAPLYGLS